MFGLPIVFPTAGGYHHLAAPPPQPTAAARPPRPPPRIPTHTHTTQTHTHTQNLGEGWEVVGAAAGKFVGAQGDVEIGGVRVKVSRLLSFQWSVALEEIGVGSRVEINQKNHTNSDLDESLS